MPQMSPLMWMLLMIINIMLLYIMISLMVFSQFKIHSKLQNKSPESMKNWKYIY